MQETRYRLKTRLIQIHGRLIIEVPSHCNDVSALRTQPHLPDIKVLAFHRMDLPTVRKYAVPITFPVVYH